MPFRKYLCTAIILAAQTLHAGTWAPLTHPAPAFVSVMLLLPDGTVMASNVGGAVWFRLTPDIHGSYVNGTWTTLNPMHDSRLYFSSVVLTNGNVLVAGGEYGSGINKSEIYNPVTGVWTSIPVPDGIIAPSGFGDAISKILPNGNVLVAPNFPATNGNTALFIAASNTWAVGPKLVRGNNEVESSWVRLPDDSILTIDSISFTNSERYIPSLNQWVDDATLPTVIRTSGSAEIGGALLLPDSRAIFLGANGNTAIYTPSGTTAPGAWSAGSVIPNGYGILDGPAAMMVNGKILCQVGSRTNFNGPSYFFEYDYLSNSFTQVNAPNGLSDGIPPFQGAMLDLPDGTVLYSRNSTDLYVYQPDGPVLSAAKPAISNIVANADGSYTLTGTLLNGISAGAVYGDDAQMDSNYPLVRLTDSVSNVFYERTYNWTSTSALTGNKLVATRFTNSAALPPGNYSLAVVANGVSSDPWNFLLPPALSITPSDGNVVLTWPTNPLGFSLQSTTNLASAAWNANLAPSVVGNSQNVVTNPVTGPQMFFRLSQ